MGGERDMSKLNFQIAQLHRFALAAVDILFCRFSAFPGLLDHRLDVRFSGFWHGGMGGCTAHFVSHLPIIEIGQTNWAHFEIINGRLEPTVGFKLPQGQN